MGGVRHFGSVETGLEVSAHRRSHAARGAGHAPRIARRRMTRVVGLETRIQVMVSIVRGNGVVGLEKEGVRDETTGGTFRVGKIPAGKVVRH